MLCHKLVYVWYGAFFHFLFFSPFALFMALISLDVFLLRLCSYVEILLRCSLEIRDIADEYHTCSVEKNLSFICLCFCRFFLVHHF